MSDSDRCDDAPMDMDGIASLLTGPDVLEKDQNDPWRTATIKLNAGFDYEGRRVLLTHDLGAACFNQMLSILFLGEWEEGYLVDKHTGERRLVRVGEPIRLGFSSCGVQTKMRTLKSRYASLINGLNPHHLYTVNQISLRAKRADRKGVGHAFVRLRIAYGFPLEGDGQLWLEGRAPERAWFGWRWQDLMALPEGVREILPEWSKEALLEQSGLFLYADVVMALGLDYLRMYTRLSSKRESGLKHHRSNHLVVDMSMFSRFLSKMRWVNLKHG